MAKSKVAVAPQGGDRSGGLTYSAVPKKDRRGA